MKSAKNYSRTLTKGITNTIVKQFFQKKFFSYRIFFPLNDIQYCYDKCLFIDQIIFKKTKFFESVSLVKLKILIINTFKAIFLTNPILTFARSMVSTYFTTIKIVILIKNRNLACGIPFSAFRIPPFRDNLQKYIVELMKKIFETSHFFCLLKNEFKYNLKITAIILFLDSSSSLTFPFLSEELRKGRVEEEHSLEINKLEINIINKKRE
ncbi:hypothetical protein BpHYR1_038602 [Brachionus plicatilis]|uniref:Uncharacterized protein n=1 Tax=Brachionus plicatilis TaxID=10195 RepID=A0A3M7PQS2_BRAPC|nr:hypothetical protein BpHYR1_038602 [Brachionus plicatilis]